MNYYSTFFIKTIFVGFFFLPFFSFSFFIYIFYLFNFFLNSYIFDYQKYFTHYDLLLIFFVQLLIIFVWIPSTVDLNKKIWFIIFISNKNQANPSSIGAFFKMKWKKKFWKWFQWVLCVLSQTFKNLWMCWCVNWLWPGSTRLFRSKNLMELKK